MTGIGTDDAWSDDRWPEDRPRLDHDLWSEEKPRLAWWIILIRVLTSIPAVILGSLSFYSSLMYWLDRIGRSSYSDDQAFLATFALIFAIGGVLVLLPAVLVRAWKWRVLLPSLFLAVAAGYDFVFPFPRP